MGAQNSTPRVVVDIYPYEGGKYTVTGDQAGVLECITHKDIRNTNPGTFQFRLAPGGPLGPNSGPSWTEIITPMSLVVIGMKRYDHRQIVMIGVVSSPAEIQSWVTGRGVLRTITVSGYDFQYFFATDNYYTLTMLGATAGAVFGTIGLPAILGSSLLGGTPASLGEAWYNTIMAGNEGMLSQTYFQYNGSSINFSQIMSNWFEEYPTPAGGVEIPIGDFFMVTEGNWMQKFLGFFPFPWYEFFVITAPTSYSQYAIGQSYQSSASPISLDFKDGQGFLSATPTIVARVNPLPYTNSYKQGSTPSNGTYSMDSTRWSNLQKFNLENTGFIKSDISFNIDEVRNFYIVNPTWYNQMFGVSNNNVAPFLYLFATWIDTGSIHRYGYRPEVAQVQWFADPAGLASQKNASNPLGYKALIQNLALRQTSYFEPTPNMASGEIVMELRPDIIPGNRFSYAPFKNGVEWDFYITSVTQSYVFGEQSTTTLGLSRGLPKTVYDDVKLLTQVHTGYAMRQNGLYVPGIPGEPNQIGLQPIDAASPTTKQILGQIAQVYINPMGATGQ